MVSIFRPYAVKRIDMSNYNFSFTNIIVLRWPIEAKRFINDALQQSKINECSRTIIQKRMFAQALKGGAPVQWVPPAATTLS